MTAQEQQYNLWAANPDMLTTAQLASYHAMMAEKGEKKQVPPQPKQRQAPPTPKKAGAKMPPQPKQKQAPPEPKAKKITE